MSIVRVNGDTKLIIKNDQQLHKILFHDIRGLVHLICILLTPTW